METREKTFFRDGTFNIDVFEQDKDRILALYRERGFLDAQIIEDRVEYEWRNPQKQDVRGIFIIITIHEGEKYYFDGYTIEIESDNGKPLFTPESLLRGLQLNKVGDIFNDTLFQRDRQTISFRYASEGHIFARVVPNRTITEREVKVGGSPQTRKFVKIDFTISEGPKAYIENIIIKGNRKTKEKVIRRELIIKEGELFNAARMQLSRERVFNLGYFKQVNFDVRPGSRDGYMNLIVDVEEQPSGTISLGGGYGTTSGFSIFADITENNFLGRGQIAGIKFTYGPYMAAVTLSFIERWLFDWPVAFRTSISYGLYTFQESSIFPTGTSVSEYQRQTFGYSLGSKL
jgi:outer membrane protein insertion porin family